MKIGIDARFFGPKDKGFGRYTEQLIRNLEQINPPSPRLRRASQYFIFLRKDSWKEYEPKNPNFKKVLANYRWYGIKEQILLPLKLKKYKLDLVHFTHFNVPIFYRGKFIVTIHDLILRHFPTSRKDLRNFLFYPLKELAYKIAFGKAIRRAEKIIAVSQYTKDDILKYYPAKDGAGKINPDKIKVIYEGVQCEEVRPPQIDVNIRRSNLQKYLLYVGNAYPHKNLERLILAFKKLVDDGLDYQLVLVGGEDYFYRKLKLKIENWKLKIKDGIIFAGFMSDDDLDALYRNANLYAFPSLYEGFGLPPLEAMARGVPVVSSNATCLPEILGDAAFYFNPLDIDDMARVIKETLSSDRARKALIQKGFEQIKKYSWRKMAEETLKLYSKCTVL